MEGICVHGRNIEGLVPGQRISTALLQPTCPVTVCFSLFQRQETIERAKEPTSIAVWGDMGVVPLGFKVSDTILKDHQEAPFNATMLFGDISYAGIDTEIKILNVTKADEWEFVWDLFGRQVEPLSSRIPFMVGVGNHDMFYGAAAYSTRFGMPWQKAMGKEIFGIRLILDISTW